MENSIDMTITIELLWDIVSQKEPDKNDNAAAGGIYQIYGTHPIYGRNALLYIGRSILELDRRLNAHKKNWIIYEYDHVTIYYGKLAPTSEFKIDDIKMAIDRAEALLVYFCAPAYNSNLIADIDKKHLKEENITVRNYGQIGSLPTEVSTAWYKSKVWNDNFFVK